MTAPEIQRIVEAENISARTVQRRLVEFGLFGRIAAKKPHVNTLNKKKRLRFAKEHEHWTIENWKNILWSDESKFNLCYSDGIRYVRRPVNTRFNPRYTIGTFKHGGGNIMVWGAFSYFGVGPLYWIKERMDTVKYRQILLDIMLPYATENMPESWVFQQDNDPKHTARAIKLWLEENNVRLLEWPSQSPDLNPIEHLWQEIKTSLKGKCFKKKEDLFEKIKEEWFRVPIEKNSQFNKFYAR